MIKYLLLIPLLQVVHCQQTCYGIKCENVADILAIEKAYNNHSGDTRYYVVMKVNNYTENAEEARAEVVIGRSECYKKNTTCYPDVDSAQNSHKVIAYSAKLANGTKGAWSVHCSTMSCSEYDVRAYMIKDMLLKVTDEYNAQSEFGNSVLAFEMKENKLEGNTHILRLGMVNTTCMKPDFKCDLNTHANYEQQFSVVANLTVVPGRQKPVIIFKV
uniref:Chemokine binding protein n=1 Tax=Bursaphelenchus xylophilus TaxID=6326 RepID=A0A1I7RZ05_BURXY